MKRWIVVLGLLGLAGCGGGEATDPSYIAEIDQWHAGRLENLRSETGWLTLVGLHELPTGRLSVGSGPNADVRLIDKVPAHIGDLEVNDAAVVFDADPAAGVAVLVDDRTAPLTRMLLKTDAQGAPTRLACGPLVFYVIDRQGQLFLRVKDVDSRVRADFQGIDRFPVRSKWRLKARVEGEAGQLKVPNVLGGESEEPTPGVLVFRIDAKEYRVSPTGERGGPLFLVFADATNGHETYAGGRFLAIDAPDEDGLYVLDFNRAYNPPCVFTPYATCPLPSPENSFGIAIAAGEKMWGEQH